MTKQQVLDQALQLPRDEQIEIANELYGDYPDAGPMSTELAEELERRIAEDEANPAPVEDLEVVLARLRNKGD